MTGLTQKIPDPARLGLATEALTSAYETIDHILGLPHELLEEDSDTEEEDAHEANG